MHAGRPVASNINYATPRPDAEITASDIETLVSAFRSMSRRPRLEYVVTCAPGLEGLLLAAGFTVEERHEFLTCRPESLVSPPSVDGFVVRQPENRAERAAMAATQGEAFGGAFEVSDADVDRLETLRQRGGFEVAAFASDGICAGAGQAAPPGGEVSEIAGIPVRAPYRRRGLGGAITAALSRQILTRVPTWSGSKRRVTIRGESTSGSASARQAAASTCGCSRTGPGPRRFQWSGPQPLAGAPADSVVEIQRSGHGRT